MRVGNKIGEGKKENGRGWITKIPHTRIRVSERVAEMRERERRRGEKASKWEDPKVWKSLGERV